MSYDLHVLTNSPLPTPAAWQAVINSCGFDLCFDPAFSMHDHSGWFPVQLEGKETGCEMDISSSVFEEEFPNLCHLLNQEQLIVITFSWGGSLWHCASGCILAATLALLTNGVVYDPQIDATSSGLAMLHVAQECLAEAQQT